MDLPFDLDREVVRLIKSKSIELPTFPGVALQLQRLIASGDYGISQLAKLVESDQALATVVLRTANSAFYVGAGPITTLTPAITRVGAASLHNIAVAGTLGVQLSMEGPLLAMRKDGWRRSLVSALLCQELAPGRRLDPGEAFLAGLLHDFGETIAYACFEIALELHPKTPPQPAASWLAEAQRYHVELGMALAEEWKLPGYVAAAVARHHDADLSGADFPAVVELVAVVDAVARRLGEEPLVEPALAAVAGLSSAERTTLTSLLMRVPAFLESFEPDSAPPPVAPQSLVVAPPTELTKSKPVDFGVAVATRSGRVNYRATAMSTAGLRMEGPVPQVERQLINLELEAGPKLCAAVQKCWPSAEGCVVEIKPFAMDRKAQADWTRLLAA